VTLANRIEELLINSEPRLHELSVEVLNQEDINTVRVRIFFRVRNLPLVQTLEVDLQRVR
jgi:predicted component of type VI protein secretion system